MDDTRTEAMMWVEVDPEGPDARDPRLPSPGQDPARHGRRDGGDQGCGRVRKRVIVAAVAAVARPLPPDMP